MGDAGHWAFLSLGKGDSWLLMSCPEKYSHPHICGAGAFGLAVNAVPAPLEKSGC